MLAEGTRFLSQINDSLLLSAVIVVRVSSFVLVFQAPVGTGHCNKDKVVSAYAVGCITGKGPSA